MNLPRFIVRPSSRGRTLILHGGKTQWQVIADIDTRAQNFARQFAEFIDGLKRTFEPAAKNLFLIGQGLLELERQSKLIDEAGFIPHPTMPQDLIRQSSGDPTRLSDLLEHYYEEKWPEVRDVMIARVNGYQIDNEAKDAFREALVAHEHDLYRSVVRHLFPEIERVARTELYNGVPGLFRTALNSLSKKCHFQILMKDRCSPSVRSRVSDEPRQEPERRPAKGALVTHYGLRQLDH